MSSTGRPGTAWAFYIDDMIAFSEKVLAYTGGMDQQAFTVSGVTYDAVLRNLELIGEAATRIPEDVRQAYPEISWRMTLPPATGSSTPTWASMTTSSGASFETIFLSALKQLKQNLADK